MKTLTKFAVAAMMLTAASSAKAEWVSGHLRNNGTCVNSYFRTPANGTSCDYPSYRSYPSQQSGYISPRANCLGPDYTRPKTVPYVGDPKPDTAPLPYTGNHSLKLLHDESRSAGFDL
jgi:hypothetical protein